jgi:serine/threonine protein phosphatase PrpC
MEGWNYLHASVQGSSHLEKNISCQDYSFPYQHNDFTICVVSDGASTCEYSDIGSINVAQFANQYFWELITKKKWNNYRVNITESEWKFEAQKTLKKIRNELEEKFTMQGYTLESLSCTIIIVIHLKNKLLVTHIGDGRAGYCTSKDEWFSLMKPCKGIYSNETVFITSNIWNDEATLKKYIESKIFDATDIKAFCLLSDGCENASFECYQFDNILQTMVDINKPFKDFFNDNVNIHIPNLISEGKTEEELNEIWACFLKDGNAVLKNESDDKTMILAIKNFEKKM